jgi:hypothetical protein
MRSCTGCHRSYLSLKSQCAMHRNYRTFIGTAFTIIVLIPFLGSHLAAVHAQESTPDSVTTTTPMEIRYSLLVGIGSFDVGNLNDSLDALGYAPVPSLAWNPPIVGAELEYRPPDDRFSMSIGFMFFGGMSGTRHRRTELVANLGSIDVGYDIYDRGRLNARLHGGVQVGVTQVNLGTDEFSDIPLDSAQHRQNFLALNALNINLHAALGIDYAFNSASTTHVTRGLTLGLRIGATMLGLSDWRANGSRISATFAYGPVPRLYAALVLTLRVAANE